MTRSLTSSASASSRLKNLFVTGTDSVLPAGVFLLYWGRYRSLMSSGLIWTVNHKASVYLGLWDRKCIGVSEGLKKLEACHTGFQNHFNKAIWLIKEELPSTSQVLCPQKCSSAMSCLHFLNTLQTGGICSSTQKPKIGFCHEIRQMSFNDLVKT